MGKVSPRHRRANGSAGGVPGNTEAFRTVGAKPGMSSERPRSAGPPNPFLQPLVDSVVIVVGGADRAHNLIQNLVDLGAVLVVTPTPGEERRLNAATVATSGRQRPSLMEHGLRVDGRAHCVRCHGRQLDLTELEFRVMAALAGDPGRAWSFQELRAAG